jgi:hypothetical protein
MALIPGSADDCISCGPLPTLTPTPGDCATCGPPPIPPQDDLEYVQSTITAVNNLQANGAINSGQSSALTAPLNAALQSLGSGNLTAAQNQLNAFRNQVLAFMAGGILTVEDANALLNP